jgi:hypothetical protein
MVQMLRETQSEQLKTKNGTKYSFPVQKSVLNEKSSTEVRK